jgi:hypothetical protein
MGAPNGTGFKPQVFFVANRGGVFTQPSNPGCCTTLPRPHETFKDYPKCLKPLFPKPTHSLELCKRLAKLGGCVGSGARWLTDDNTNTTPRNQNTTIPEDGNVLDISRR